MIKRHLLGLDIYDTNISDLIIFLNGIIQRKKKKTVFGISAAAYARLKFRPDLYGIYKQFDILVAEGAGLPHLANLFDVKISEKIGMVNLTYSILELANKNSYSVLLFGATEEVNDLAEQKIRSLYPKIILCKGINGYFNEDDTDSIIDQINDSNPNILLIGISYPVKERFTIKYKPRLNTNLIIPCGGAFEVIAGKVKVPKYRLNKIPIAWFYRFYQEPKRMFKDIFVTVLYSIFYVIPILYFKHITGMERNPDIGNFFKLSGYEWDSINGQIKS